MSFLKRNSPQESIPATESGAPYLAVLSRDVGNSRTLPDQVFQVSREFRGKSHSFPTSRERTARYGAPDFVAGIDPLTIPFHPPAGRRLKRNKFTIHVWQSRMGHPEVGGTFCRIPTADPSATLLCSLSCPSRGACPFDGPDYRLGLVHGLLILFFRHRIGHDAGPCLNVALLSFEKHAADGNAGVEIS
jgi:hypothetical protein